jgi:hypothetical protein
VRRLTLLRLVLAAGLAPVASDGVAWADFWSDAGYAIKEGPHDAGTTIRKAAHETGNAIKQGAHASGHALKQAARDTGHAIENGVHRWRPGCEYCGLGVVGDFSGAGRYLLSIEREAKMPEQPKAVETADESGASAVDPASGSPSDVQPKPKPQDGKPGASEGDPATKPSKPT